MGIILNQANKSHYVIEDALALENGGTQYVVKCPFCQEILDFHQIGLLGKRITRLDQHLVLRHYDQCLVSTPPTQPCMLLTVACSQTTSDMCETCTTRAARKATCGWWARTYIAFVENRLQISTATRDAIS